MNGGMTSTPDAPQQAADQPGLAERLVFGMRPLILALCAVATALFAWSATGIRPDASFEKMVPTNHPYIQNFLKHRDDLSGLSNVLRIVVVAEDGDILDKDYLETLRQITDTVFYIDGVDRGNLRSLWTPNMRWVAVTDSGFDGGLVIPDAYDGSDRAIEEVRLNILRSNQVGVLVANDFKSSIVQAPLLSADPETGAPLDYARLSAALEREVRDKFSSDTISIRITGFAKLIGDLIDAVTVVLVFFAIAVVVMAALLFAYTRCLRSTALAVLCSGVAVVWQLGLLTALGYGVDPYSVLVPFLIFAVGASHAIQIISAAMRHRAAGCDRRQSARRAFRALAAPGATALTSDSVGFLTLIVIPIAVIAELAVAAGLGVAMVLVTNLVLQPILLSYTGVSAAAAERAGRAQTAALSWPWSWVAGCASRRATPVILLAAAGLVGVGAVQSASLQIGDLDAGAPELRPDSRYNRDVAYLAENYATSTDVLVIMAESPAGECVSFPSLDGMDRLQARLEATAGVQGVVSIANFAKLGLQGTNEGNLRWRALSRNQLVANATLSRVPQGFFNGDCSMAPIVVFLADHKADTLTRVTGAVEAFTAETETGPVSFALAAGNAGVEAATNDVIALSQHQILALVYGAVAVLILLTFRSLVALIVILAPLALTSLLAQALMSGLGMGVKVATLPVIALGVGIGVDYGIYVYDRLRTLLKEGLPLDEAYAQTVSSAGGAVAFTAFALAIGVVTWVAAPTKFQADMGVMLTFMFLMNMVGALVLLPALMRCFRWRESSA